MDILFIILINILSRIVPHLPNMTAVGAMAIFAGSKYRLRTSVFVVGLSMLWSDYILGFHSVLWATYGSFLVAILLGRLLKKQNKWKMVGVITFISSCQFYFLTNFAVWLTGSMYPRTIGGLIHCYTMALPFFRNSLVGDLLYVTVFFGAYEIVHKLTTMYATDFIKKARI